MLAEVLAYLRVGDTLVVWRLDRLGRSLPHLIQTLTDLATRGIGTTTPGGKLVFHVLGRPGHACARAIPRAWGCF